MNNNELISTLNDLIETCIDGEKGFDECSHNVSSTHLKTLFSNRSNECSQAAKELQNIVRTLGGEAATGGSVGGVLHRRWIDIKAAILGKDDAIVLNACEQGEDIAMHTYRHALLKDLPPDVRSVVDRQYCGVIQNHNTVKSLRDQLSLHN